MTLSKQQDRPTDLDRRQFQTLLTGLGITLTATRAGSAGAGRVESFLLPPNGWVPNNARSSKRCGTKP